MNPPRQKVDGRACLASTSQAIESTKADIRRLHWTIAQHRALIRISRNHLNESVERLMPRPAEGAMLPSLIKQKLTASVDAFADPPGLQAEEPVAE